MSDITETPVKRGPGRPPKVQPAVATITAPVVEQTIPDEELENYGGNIAAWEAAGRRGLALRGDYLPGSQDMWLPDLNPPGTLVLKDEPSIRFNWAFWEDNPSATSRSTYALLKAKGYKPALVTDFIVCPELRDTIVDDGTGRLTFAASKEGSHVVMYQSQADYDFHRKALLRLSDEIQKTAEERAAATQEALQRGGLSGVKASFTVEK